MEKEIFEMLRMVVALGAVQLAAPKAVEILELTLSGEIAKIPGIITIAMAVITIAMAVYVVLRTMPVLLRALFSNFG